MLNNQLIITNQLELAKEELERLDLDATELVYDYVFEALRLHKELCKPFSEN